MSERVAGTLEVYNDPDDDLWAGAWFSNVLLVDPEVTDLAPGSYVIVSSEVFEAMEAVVEAAELGPNSKRVDQALDTLDRLTASEQPDPEADNPGD